MTTALPTARLECPVQIPAGGETIEGDLTLPPGGAGIVLFAHGSGSSRHSPRNRFVAGVLNAAGLGTVLMDLLTRGEEAVDAHDARFRFDIELLAERLAATIDWLMGYRQTANLIVGCFGASTGAAAALQAASARPEVVRAVVSRGGRPDLAASALPTVRAPTLLIVGGLDEGVMELNRGAYLRLGTPVKELAIVPGASHLFEETGTLEVVAKLAKEWFLRHLKPES